MGEPLGEPDQVATDAARPPDLTVLVAEHDTPGNRVHELLPDARSTPAIGDRIERWSYDGTEHWNQNAGVLIASGGPILRGARVEGARVFDVAPTILALLGVPVSSELEGVVLEGLFAPGAVPPPERVARYDIAPVGTRVERTPYDEEAHERLRALGYVE